MFHTQTSLQAMYAFKKGVGINMNLMNRESGGRFDYKEINKNIVRKLAQFPRLL